MGSQGGIGHLFGYDAANRLKDWRQGTTYAAPATTRTWDLSLVGDWNSTTVGGLTETRLHTPVHEISSINGTSLEHDFRGNLSRGLPYADGTDARYVWDVENRLSSATASDADMGATGTATYRYDALGRRVGKTVWGETTTYIHAGAQVVQTTTAAVVLPPAAAADDGSLVAANGRPPGADYLGGGGILGQALQRVNFQPELSAIPTGFVADKGKVQAARSNALTYGWDVAQTGAVERRAFPLPQFDTHLRMKPVGQTTAGSWSIALPNGTYAVVAVMGDPSSRNQTNDIQLNGVACLDATPATTVIEYRLGNFDGYIQNVVVTDGFLHITAASTAFDPKLCFVEIGVEGVLATAAEVARLADVIDAANNQTAKNRPASADVASYVYGSYVDEVVAYQQTVNGVATRYYPHCNHLYSVAALTNAAGAVVERYSYDAYGKQKITDASGNLTRAKSGVGWDRGFTGYISDQETGLLHARARQYSPTLGRFISRDKVGYVDGALLYGAYFAPNSADPSGNTCCVTGIDIVIDGKFQGGKTLGDYYPHIVDHKKPMDQQWFGDGTTAGKIHKPSDVGWRTQTIVSVQGSESDSTECVITQHYVISETTFPKEKVNTDPIDDINTAGWDNTAFPYRQKWGWENGSDQGTISIADPPCYPKFASGGRYKSIHKYKTCAFSTEGSCPAKCKYKKCCIEWTWTVEIDGLRVIQNTVTKGTQQCATE
jgi:RHS repeat-associated protein